MWNECILWRPSQLCSQPFTPTAGLGTHLWERDKRQREREVRLRHTFWLKTPQCTTSLYFSTQYWSWSASRPNKWRRSIWCFFRSADTMGHLLPGQQRWVWGLSSCQRPKGLQAALCASQRSCDWTHLWWLNSDNQRGSNQSNRVVQITTPGIAVQVQLLSLYRYQDIVSAHQILFNKIYWILICNSRLLWYMISV